MKRPESSVVLDSSALLALVHGETGAAKVEATLDTAAISAVNLSEAHAKLVEKGMAEADAWSALASARIRVIDFDGRQARLAGALRLSTRDAGLSFGDRACVALARILTVPVVTADRAWARVDLGVDVRLIR